MIRALALPLLLLAAFPAGAQTVPDVQLDNPRIQRVHYAEGASVLLTIMPGSGTTIMLEPGEVIARVTLGSEFDYSVRVSPEGNSLLVLADHQAEESTMLVETDRRRYPFALRTGEGLTAAYLVRFTYGELPPAGAVAAAPEAPLPRQSWSYRLRGDDTVRPLRISDDGERTYITYHPEQALPAVFAIGQTGDEELVNGHMRGEQFVIDRVYAELVFRLDDERLRAQRNASPDREQGG
ncbi:TrbG/VirB9 family P-type conjugative transfer protein [Erythrobacter sp. EC-HK427]|uniref:TrbG/VirB9 family P-type conjugative transfer protein n=1 Tax=Erythrobacter sp. EC-HK427 TaxID=2038396 RepID=UPI00125865CE|nr:TrbG/VirB9 family P-type conjugative transfer protein [Erythrobacter sp. EC-HK427]VVS98526.1 conserved exported hypothetical protein [Erythrobacter sp. EC-HK427]